MRTQEIRQFPACARSCLHLIAAAVTSSRWRRRGLLFRVRYGTLFHRHTDVPWPSGSIDMPRVLLATFERVASYSALSAFRAPPPPSPTDKLPPCLLLREFPFRRFFAFAAHDSQSGFSRPAFRIVIIPVDRLFRPACVI